jgi:hypothetical protein
MKKPVISLYAWVLRDLRSAQKAEKVLRERAETLEDSQEKSRLENQATAAASRAEYASMIITGLQGLGYLDEERP